MLGIGSNLRRPIAEIAIIVAGVLIALGLDSWNDNRIDRNLEAEYLGRLVEDVQFNVERSAEISENFALKLASLDEVFELGEQDFQLNPDSAVVALRTGAVYGWALPEFRTGTLEELQSTGNLGLIRDVELRAALSDYDVRLRSLVETIEARMTEYSKNVYSLVSGLEDTSAEELYTPELDTETVLEVVSTIQSLAFRRLLVEERNYAAYAARRTKDIKAMSEETLASLNRVLAD